MIIIEKEIVASASPATIFQIYQEVDNWSQWDPDTKSSTLNNGLTLGSKGSLTPTKGNTVPMIITAVRENESFTATSKTVLFHMDFVHELMSVVGGTKIVHRVKISGLLKPLLALILRPQIERGLPVTLQRLKAQAEMIEHTNTNICKHLQPFLPETARQ